MGRLLIKPYLNMMSSGNFISTPPLNTLSWKRHINNSDAPEPARPNHLSHESLKPRLASPITRTAYKAVYLTVSLSPSAILTMDAQQPITNTMTVNAANTESKQEEQVMRLRGGAHWCFDCLAYTTFGFY